jgi:hypothetical protein
LSFKATKIFQAVSAGFWRWKKDAPHVRIFKQWLLS